MNSPAEEVYQFEHFRFDARTRILSRDDGGPQRRLPHKPHTLLIYLLRNHTRPVGEDEVCAHIWPEFAEKEVKQNRVKELYNQLRRALDEEPSREDARYIKYKKGEAFEFLIPVRILRDNLGEPLPVVCSTQHEVPIQPGGRPVLYSLRGQLLARVRHDWIEGVLNKSLYHLARIDVDLAERPELVENSLTIIVQEAAKSPRPLPPHTRISSVFDVNCGTLLILGPPGGGKTTLLLELAKDLLDRADQDERQLIPVVFNLSAWVLGRAKLTDWMVDELNQRYGTPLNEARYWLDTGEILPLLDGLDEVADVHRETCVARINEFRNEHGLLPIAICSRTQEYQALALRFRLPTAVLIQPLTRAQTEEYLKRGGDQLCGLRQALASDAIPWDLLNTPLMLSVATIAYKDTINSNKKELKSKSVESQRQELFSKYVDVMFHRRTASTEYRRDQTLHWLQWLAGRLIRDEQSVFQLEDLGPRTLADRSSIRLVNSVVALLIGCIAGFIVGMVFGRLCGMVYGLCVSLISLMRLGKIRAPEHKEDYILPIFMWSVLQASICALMLGTVYALAIDLVSGIGAAVGSFVGCLVHVMLGNSFAAVFRQIEKHYVLIPTVPNEGTKRAGTRVIMGLLFLVVGYGVPPIIAVSVISKGGRLLAAVLAGLLQGAAFCVLLAISENDGRYLIEHWLARLLMRIRGYAPLRYVRFLDFATERNFLRKSGGRYIFIHRMFLEHFASLSKDKGDSVRQRH